MLDSGKPRALCIPQYKRQIQGIMFVEQHCKVLPPQEISYLIRISHPEGQAHLEGSLFMNLSLRYQVQLVMPPEKNTDLRNSLSRFIFYYFALEGQPRELSKASRKDRLFHFLEDMILFFVKFAHFFAPGGPGSTWKEGKE